MPRGSDSQLEILCAIFHTCPLHHQTPFGWLGFFFLFFFVLFCFFRQTNKKAAHLQPLEVFSALGSILSETRTSFQAPVPARARPRGARTSPPSTALKLRIAGMWGSYPGHGVGSRPPGKAGNVGKGIGEEHVRLPSLGLKTRAWVWSPQRICSNASPSSATESAEAPNQLSVLASFLSATLG